MEQSSHRNSSPFIHHSVPSRTYLLSAVVCPLISDPRLARRVYSELVEGLVSPRRIVIAR